VSVTQTLTAIVVSPANAAVPIGGAQQFSASAKDQFGVATSSQPSVAWTVSGGGSISASGLFTAGSSAGGPFTVTAASGGKQGIASVSVTGGNHVPTVASAASASPNPVNGKTTALSVLGADDGGEANLAYTWASSGPAPVGFSANGTNAAKNATATFGKAGSYVFTATIRDQGGLAATSSVTVTVNHKFSKLALSPSTATVASSSSLQFTALAADQFEEAMPTPALSWSTDGGGEVDASGVFTAGAQAGGPFMLSAATEGVGAEARVMVEEGGGSGKCGFGAGAAVLACALASLRRCRRRD
jgi:hypothetical protein